MEALAEEELLILVKTYPSPSTRYRETTCVAAVNTNGELRRIFPVPFRLLGGESQFKKWEWIKAKLAIPTTDRRPESRRIDVDSIVRTGEVIPVHKGDWGERLRYIEKHIVQSFSALEERRQKTGATLGAIRPSELHGLEIKPAKEPEWTDDDKVKLMQDGLFDGLAVKNRPLLKSYPLTFTTTTPPIRPVGEKRTNTKSTTGRWAPYIGIASTFTASNGRRNSASGTKPSLPKRI